MDLVTDSDYKEKISTNGKTIVKFFAPWCGPCKMIAPLVKEISEKNPDVTFLEINIDTDTVLARELKVRAVPTFALYQDGTFVKTYIGFNKSEINNLVENEH